MEIKKNWELSPAHFGPLWKYVEDDEICYIDYDEISNRYDLIFSYDSGYCYGRIKDIKFCPLCGRELMKE